MRGEQPSRASVPDVAEALRPAPFHDQFPAARAVGERGDETTVGRLVEIMVTDPRRAAGAAVALDVLDARGYPVSPDLLFDALARIRPGQWRDTYDTINAPSLSWQKRVRELTPAEVSSTRSLPVSEVVFAKIAQLLRDHAEPRHVPALVQLLAFTAESPSDNYSRDAARTHEARVRDVGYQVLPFVDGAAAVDVLADELRRRPDVDKVRRALCKAVHPHAVDVLLEFLAEPPAGTGDANQVRSARGDFAAALGRHRDPRALEPLLALFDSGAGGQGLAEFGGPEVVAAMIDRLEAPGGTRALGAIAVLGKVGDSAAVGPLVRFLDANAWTGPAIKPAVEALGRVGDAEAVQALCAKLRPVDHENAELMAKIAEALRQIGHPGALPALRRIDPGPLGQWDLAKAKDYSYDPEGEAKYWYLKRCDDIHQAIVALESAAR
ncbi:HEAT repeat domain-containing protein [Dactylosporangium sp. NPDC051541]|uniref:HEAT repeat domain-containing protein n=1 Tax=Dactylosporangium sp. NPDC051541 TaxID=3363977 RepID=UPI0037AD76EC